MLATLAALKILATTLSFVSGTPGGMFAPALFVGAMLGGAVGGVEHLFFPHLAGTTGTYALVKEIAELLGKTHNAVRLRAITLGVESCYSPAEQTQQEATRKKISCTLQGISESEWDGFKESINALVRKSEEYQNWRKDVFERDGYLCTNCGAKGILHAHHIKEFAKYPELRFDVSNGVTLCVPCHKIVHKKN